MSKEPTQPTEGAGMTRRDDSRPGLLRFVLSVLSSAVALAAVGCVCALFYPILKELRALRVRGDDGTEQKMLGFWLILVLSVGAACFFSASSWLLTHLDLAHSLTTSGRPTHNSNEVWLNYGMVVLNGIMAMLTVIWSLI